MKKKLIYSTSYILPFKLITTTTIFNYLYPKKAPEHDLITSLILKRLPPNGVKLLTYIYNTCLRLSYFSDKWKVAIVSTSKKTKSYSFSSESYHKLLMQHVTTEQAHRVVCAIKQSFGRTKVL